MKEHNFNIMPENNKHITIIIIITMMEMKMQWFVSTSNLVTKKLLIVQNWSVRL